MLFRYYLIFYSTLHLIHKWCLIKEKVFSGIKSNWRVWRSETLPKWEICKPICSSDEFLAKTWIHGVYWTRRRQSWHIMSLCLAWSSEEWETKFQKWAATRTLKLWFKGIHDKIGQTVIILELSNRGFLTLKWPKMTYFDILKKFKSNLLTFFIDTRKVF